MKLLLLVLAAVILPGGFIILALRFANRRLAARRQHLATVGALR